jgi:uncharacterized protein involved in high-affinity Fe2+ transport
MEPTVDNIKLISSALMLAVMLSACARQEEPEGVIPAGYKSALEKAQGVEGTLQDAMEMQAEEIDQGER